MIEFNQAEAAEELCEIGWKLDEEIRRRKITEVQIEKYIKNAEFDPQDQLMVSTYIYLELNSLNGNYSDFINHLFI